MIKQDKYETVIGLEVHAQLKTKSKVFCFCSTEYGNEPNSQVCPVCMGLPGSLPVLNEKAVLYAVKMGLATRSEINLESTFARKNYFYPDLPKGYQITQYEKPLCENGFVEIEIDERIRKIGIERIHVEEDAGKSIHAEKWIKKNETVVDLNRCGVPLIEIVSKMEIRSPLEAYQYLIRLKQLLLYLNICDGHMEEGSLRCDANISVRLINSKKLGVKTELKNLNSFKAVKKALAFEINRQINLLDKGKNVDGATLLWDERDHKTIPMRVKEKTPDYRYFNEPDLMPLRIDLNWLRKVREGLPELPLEKRNRFIAQYGLLTREANQLTEKNKIAEYFEEVNKLVNKPKLVVNWILGEFFKMQKDKSQNKGTLLPAEKFAGLLNLVKKKKINTGTAKKIFREMLDSGKEAGEIVKKENFIKSENHERIYILIDKIIQENPKDVKKYKSGKSQLLNYFIGQIMKETAGAADPKVVSRLLHEKLSSL